MKSVEVFSVNIFVLTLNASTRIKVMFHISQKVTPTHKVIQEMYVEILLKTLGFKMNVLLKLNSHDI